VTGDYILASIFTTTWPDQADNDQGSLCNELEEEVDVFTYGNYQLEDFDYYLKDSKVEKRLSEFTQNCFGLQANIFYTDEFIYSVEYQNGNPLPSHITYSEDDMILSVETSDDLNLGEYTLQVHVTDSTGLFEHT